MTGDLLLGAAIVVLAAGLASALPGRDSPADMVSGIPVNPGSTNPETCETNTLIQNRVVQRGNVQVR